MMLRKKFFSLVLALSSAAAFALPGVQSYIPDASGEYVYYQDTTFARPTYVGFLYYNEEQYSLRYYAAADAKTKQDEVEIELLISVNPENEKLDFTGELVVKDGDSELINYMHDLFYDLTARRQKMGAVEGAADINKNDFLDVFGGSVVMKYSALVPIFNVRAIQDDAGSEKLRLVTTGVLANSFDTSFSDFKGFPKKMSDKKRTAVKANKKALSAQSQSADGSVSASAKLDESWAKAFDNVWMQGNAGILTLMAAPVPSEDAERVECSILRSMLHSSGSSYKDLSSAKIVRGDGGSVESRFYSSEDGAVQHDVQILRRTANGFALFRLTVFDSIYQKKKSYYNAIIKSFSAN